MPAIRSSHSSELATSLTVGLGAIPGSARVEGCPPVEELPPGLYQELVTEALRRRLAGMGDADFVTRRVDRGVTAEVLAHHVGRSVEALLDLVGDEHRVEVTNQLLDLAAELVPGSRDGLDQVGPGPVELHEVSPSPTAGIRYLRPQVPLGRTDLLINARGEPSLAPRSAPSSPLRTMSTCCAPSSSGTGCASWSSRSRSWAGGACG